MFCRSYRRPVDHPVNLVENRVNPVIHCAYIVKKVVFCPVHRVILPVHRLLYKKWTKKVKKSAI